MCRINIATKKLNNRLYISVELQRHIPVKNTTFSSIAVKANKLTTSDMQTLIIRKLMVSPFDALT